MAPGGGPTVAGEHRYARERGVLRPLYVLVRGVLSLVLRMWFRVRARGSEHVPAEGAALITPNHKSFLDAFFVGMSLRRPVRFMAKRELFKGPLRWLFLRLGAFPVARGRSDAEAFETARCLLERGELVVLFPEGTRVEDPYALGSPHHGAGRLALGTRAPIVPAAIAGTQKLWLGPLPKPRRVQVSFMPAIDPRRFAGSPDALRALIDEEVWPAVREEYGRELARPGLLLAALVALGLGGRAIARRQARARPRQLGVIEPRSLRRRKARRDATERLRGIVKRS
jgi:1-acyl-sn-glycerol-3-phosphate acyltransferase